MLTGLSFIGPFTSRLIYTMTDISLTHAFYNTSRYALLTHTRPLMTTVYIFVLGKRKLTKRTDFSLCCTNQNFRSYRNNLDFSVGVKWLNNRNKALRLEMISNYVISFSFLFYSEIFVYFLFCGYFLLFFPLLFLMEDNCFTISFWFLPYVNRNQPKIYICSLPLEPLSHLPSHPTPLDYLRAPDLSSLHHTAQSH